VIKNIAADLGLMASKVRWVLQRKIFAIAASSAAYLLFNNIDNIARQSTSCRARRD